MRGQLERDIMPKIANISIPLIHPLLFLLKEQFHRRGQLEKDILPQVANISTPLILPL
jgi:hypothetical protein